MNKLACEIKDVTSLKHPSNISMNVWGLLGSSPCMAGLTERPKQLPASVSQNGSVFCPHQTCNLSHYVLLSQGLNTFEKIIWTLYKHFVPSCKHLWLGILLDKPQTLEPGVTT